MNKSLAFLFLLSIILGFVLPVTAQELSDVQKDQIKNEIDSLFNKMIEAAEVLDAEVLAQGVDDRYRAGFISNGTYFDEFNSVLEGFKAGAKGIDSQEFKFEKKKITVVSENLVLLTASGEAKVNVKNGNPFNVRFLWTFVFKKIDDNWKVIQSHQSNAR